MNLKWFTYSLCHGQRRVSLPETIEEEELCEERVIPNSTRYKNKWAVGIFLGLATSAKCRVSNSQGWWSFKEYEAVWVIYEYGD